MIFVVRTVNGKTLAGFRDIDDAEAARAYWQHRFDESSLAKGVRVEVKQVRDGSKESDAA